jgi:hypothetical protein
MLSGKEFYQAWSKAIKSPTGQDGAPRTDAQGNPLPPMITGPSAAVLGKAFSTIDRDSDPAGTAQHFADSITDPNQKELLLMRGRAADLTRRSKGLPILPHGYGESGSKAPKTSVSSGAPKGIPPSLIKGFKSLPVEAQQSIEQGLNAGQTIDQIRDTASQHGLADVVHALTDPNAKPPGPADAHHPDAAGLNAIAPIARALHGALAAHKATPADLQTQATAAGLTPGTPAWNNFIKSHS